MKRVIEHSGDVRIVIASELYWPEFTSTGRYLTHIAEGLAREHDVMVMCAQPTYAARGRRAARSQVRNGVRLHRVRSTALDKNRLLPRLVNALTFSAAMLFEGLRRVPRGSAVLAVTNPPFLPYVMAFVARLKGARFVLLVHDVYPEVLVASGLARRGGLIERLAGVASRWLYRRADRVLVLGRDMRDLIARRLGGRAAPPVIVPHWMDGEVEPMQRRGNALLRELGVDDAFVVQYAGNMGRSHDMGLIVQAAEALAGSDTPGERSVEFLLVGWGAARPSLEAAVAARGLRNVRVLNPRPGSELNTVLAACDVALITFMPGMAGASVPSRMYNIMAAGRPIVAVADDESELARVIREEDIGWVVAPRDVDGLVSTLREARAAPERLRAMGARARTAALERYRFEHMLPRYADALEPES